MGELGAETGVAQRVAKNTVALIAAMASTAVSTVA